MTIFVIIITNILIALFSFCYSKTLQNKETKGHQMYNRANLVIETSYDLPFSTLNMFVQPVLIVWAMLTTAAVIIKHKRVKGKLPSSRQIKRLIWTKERVE